MDFRAFSKIARLSRDMIVTEKIDGTNGVIAIGENGEFQIGSRNRWLTDEAGNITGDNMGFAAWAIKNRDSLMTLGVGLHYGEWWGSGIQRGYNLPKGEKRFSLFNVSRWADYSIRPACCHVVPLLYTGMFSTSTVDDVLIALARNGSEAAPGFMRPEGVVVFHTAAGYLFKKTIERDEYHKGETAG